MIGVSESSVCSNFDLYAIFSLLWLLTITLLFLLFSEYGLFLLQLVRILSFIAPGYIHKYYIRYKLKDDANHFVYLGDIKVYKIIMTLYIK